MLSILSHMNFRSWSFPYHSNLDMNVHGTIDGFNVFDQFDYTVMDFFFFCIGGKGREHHMFTSITVCVEYNIYIYFAYLSISITCFS